MVKFYLLSHNLLSAIIVNSKMTGLLNWIINKKWIMKSSGLKKKKTMRVEWLKQNLASILMRKKRKTIKILLFSKNRMTQRMDMQQCLLLKKQLLMRKPCKNWTRKMQSQSISSYLEIDHSMFSKYIKSLTRSNSQATVSTWKNSTFFAF